MDAGTRFVPDDRFYVDFTTPHPFEALEQYGLRLRAAQKAQLNPYDFPTVCAWYVGIFGVMPQATPPDKTRYGICATPGLVQEMDHIAKSGFLNYSRAAVRLVPDTYSANNEQGWWDDEHWREFGHYKEPYDTTRKYGEAIRARGGLPFTYFQLAHDSMDFRQAFAEEMLGDDPARTLDYTDPAAQAHMKRVFANLRRGGIAGMMCDYMDDVWAGEFVRGGFEDKHATAVSAYRMLFTLAKEGLGRESRIHERAIDAPLSDMSIGVVDSQRVVWDTSSIDADMVSKCGLRWYKNRVVLSYDMDAKDLLRGWKHPSFRGTDQDGRRMLLTMAYVAAGRLLLATSFRDMTPEILYDLERTFPYHAAPQSARPVDAFVSDGYPRLYDFAVSPKWHQVTFYNTDSANPQQLSVSLSGDPASGALGLDPAKEYYVYDFWNDRSVGRLKGSERLTQLLRPGEARMMSIHQVEGHPQFLSTNRHIMQGYVDMVGSPEWNAPRLCLTGTSKVVGGETYKVVIALNRYRPTGCSGQAAKCRVERLQGSGDIAVLSIDSPKNTTVGWEVSFAR